jgi:hypothetical protein
MGGSIKDYMRKEYMTGNPPKGSPKDSLPKPEEASLVKPPQTTQNKVGVAKTRKEVLKNVPDQKIIKRGKDYRSRITSRVQTSGVTKRRDVARPNLGSRVAALLKPKKKKQDEDKLG